MPDLLAALNARLPLAARQRQLDEHLRSVHRAILRSFADSGVPPRPDPADVRALAELDLIVMGPDATVSGAYPFTLEETGHIVAMPRATVNAMCSLDAIAVAPVFFSRVTVSSRCAVSGTPIVITQDGDRLSGSTPEAPWLGIRFQEVCGTASTSLCRDMVFFAGEQEARQWEATVDGEIAIFGLPAGIDLAVAFFGPLVA